MGGPPCGEGDERRSAGLDVVDVCLWRGEGRRDQGVGKGGGVSVLWEDDMNML